MCKMIWMNCASSFFFPQCTAKVKKSALQICKRLKAETIWWPFGFNFLCAGLYTAIQLHSCRHLLHWHPLLPVTLWAQPFNYIYTAFIYANKISALTLCTQIFILLRILYLCTTSFLFNPFSPAVRNQRCLLCLTRGSELCPGPQMHQHQYLCVRKAQLQLFHSASRACVTYWAVLFATWRASDWFVWSALIWRYKLDSPRAFEQCHGYIHSLNLVCGQNQFSWVDRKHRTVKCAVATRSDGVRLPLVKCMWGHLVFLTNRACGFLWTSTQCKFEMRMSGRNPRATTIVEHLLSFSLQLMFWED